jgi:hypothetical protein
MDHIEAPLTSPDLSIMETRVKPIRGRFYKSNCSTAEEGKQRFYQIWQSLDREKVNQSIDSYPARLHECIRVGGKVLITSDLAIKYVFYSQKCDVLTFWCAGLISDFPVPARGCPSIRCKNRGKSLATSQFSRAPPFSHRKSRLL